MTEDRSDIEITRKTIEFEVADRINFYRKFLVTFKIIKVSKIGKNFCKLFHIFYFMQTSNKSSHEKLYSGYEKKKRWYNIS